MRVRGAISAVGLLAALTVAPAAALQVRRPPPGPRVVRPPMRPPGKTIIDRLEKMAPAERDRVLSKLPPERRKKVEEGLQRFRQLPPSERENLGNRLERFGQLPPERQAAARRLFARFNLLPEDRKPLVGEEFQLLRQLEEADRRARLNRDEFRSRFTLAEQQLLHDFAKLLEPPGPR
jgi:hypothetical protein